MSKDNGSIRPAARRKARRFALQALYEWSISQNPMFEIEARYRVENDMHKVDLEYFHELIHEISSKVEGIDDAFLPHLDRKFHELDHVERAILRIGTYEMLHRIDVPYRVVINEGIELAKDFGATESHKYVNGVLDRVAKEHRKLERTAG
ncbi:MAG TPA: transcription antitermination factor NusB [Moraxellaceae bacterium]|nr:transcription antitermination factor NusB [Moraxellaceae bacterium]